MGRLVTILLILCLSLVPVSVNAKTATSGTDDNGNIWTYNKNTKTLTFTGTKDISDFEMDGHCPEPSWYSWSKEAEHIEIEEGITGIGKSAFSNFMNVISVKIPESVVILRRSCFSNNNFENIELPDSIKSIEDYAFSGCYRLKFIELPEGISYMGSFEFCKALRNIYIPSAIKKLGRGMFIGCESIIDIKLPPDLKIIKAFDFADCIRLKRIDIPDKVTCVYMSAFAGTGLKKIILPENVTIIKNGDYGQEVFKYKKGVGYPTKKLRVIEIHSKKLKSIQKNSFSGLSSKVVIKVPKLKKKKYTKMLRGSGLSKKVKIKTL